MSKKSGDVYYKQNRLKQLRAFWKISGQYTYLNHAFINCLNRYALTVIN